jgi:hypothetical protein
VQEVIALARYIYSWKPTQHGKRLFRRPGSGAPARQAEPETTTVDYGSLLKAELVAQADERGIDSTGTKADIIERLEQADGD